MGCCSSSADSSAPVHADVDITDEASRILQPSADSCAEEPIVIVVQEPGLTEQTPAIIAKSVAAESAIAAKASTAEEGLGVRVVRLTGSAVPDYSGAAKAAAECRLLQAEEMLRAHSGAGRELPQLFEQVLERAALVRRVRATCTLPPPPDERTAGWVRVEGSSYDFWHCWMDGGTALRVISQWVAPGTLQNQLGSIRDGDPLEALWDGSCWDMSSQHAGGSTLVRYIEKMPVLGRRYEVLVERIFCDCLQDDKNPCWVLAERNPSVENFERFSGLWQGFEIPAPSAMRLACGETGRTIEPLPGGRCRTTSAVTIPIPAALRWVCTDFMVAKVAKAMFVAGCKSWNRVLQEWGNYGMEERMTREHVFYDIVRRSSEDYIASLPESPSESAV